MDIMDLLASANLPQLEQVLLKNTLLANAAIPLKDNPATAHPLHRICDGVCNGDFPEETGIEIAKIFIRHGADLNLIQEAGTDSPLTAACSLRCDQLALFYIDQGARIDHAGCHGGTPLHWAAWCGRDVVVKRLLPLTTDVNKLCIDFKSTPLFWALHGYQFGGKENLHHQVNCVRLLLEHGADPSIPNFEGYLPKQLIRNDDLELKEIFLNL
ncbi:MAG TPA: ankyrin repeat domain-containing protein [Chryseosolibacter sp.]